MRIARFKAFAEYSNFVVTDSFDYMTPVPEITEDSCRRGFLIPQANIVYHFLQNDSWNFPLTIDYQLDAPTGFGDAERVLHLPITLSGQMLLHGSTDWEEDSFRKLPITAGRYSIFSSAWNIGLQNTDEDMLDIDDEDYLNLQGIERYHWTICPQVSSTAHVVIGQEYLY